MAASVRWEDPAGERNSTKKWGPARKREAGGCPEPSKASLGAATVYQNLEVHGSAPFLGGFWSGADQWRDICPSFSRFNFHIWGNLMEFRRGIAVRLGHASSTQPVPASSSHGAIPKKSCTQRRNQRLAWKHSGTRGAIFPLVLLHPVGRPEFPTPCLTHPPSRSRIRTSYSGNVGDLMTRRRRQAASSSHHMKSISNADLCSRNIFRWRCPPWPRVSLFLWIGVCVAAVFSSRASAVQRKLGKLNDSVVGSTQ
jgi:hypothetical protein